MKVTAITNARGEVVGCVDGGLSAPAKRRRGMTATIIPQAGQKFLEIEVPESYAKLQPLDLLEALAKQVRG